MIEGKKTNPGAEVGPVNSTGNKDITDFLLTEYENIANAHFNAQEILSRWVRFYFLVVAVPLTLLALVSRAGQDIDLLNLKPYFSFLIFLVGIVGIFISLIIFDIRLDTALYARSVNGIRKYFLGKERARIACGLVNSPELLDPSPFVVLPTDINKPSLTKLSINGWIFVLMFTIINSLYVCFGIQTFLYRWAGTRGGTLLLITVITFLAAVHLIGYKSIGKHKATEYINVSGKRGGVSP